jgi:hypothetical protein
MDQGRVEEIAEAIEEMLDKDRCFLLVVMPAGGTGTVVCISNADEGACVAALDQCKQAMQRRKAGEEATRGLH